MKIGRVRVTVTSLSAHRVADKLAREGVVLYSAERVGKNAVAVEVAGKDREKVFAILRGSCYNVEKVSPRGLARIAEGCRKRAGLLVGAALFLAAVWGAQTRVLAIEVSGNGAYYEREVLSVLREGGVERFSAVPRSFSPYRAAILALPRVSFCEMSASGGVLTVEVRVNEEAALPAREPLLAPVSGVVEELCVLRGTALVAAGDEVEAGQTVVDAVAADGSETLVIAWVGIVYPFSREYAGTEEEARLAAQLEFGDLAEIHTEPHEGGFSVWGRARATAALNLK